MGKTIMVGFASAVVVGILWGVVVYATGINKEMAALIGFVLGAAAHQVGMFVHVAFTEGRK
jgi:hypothetical protein